VWFDQQTEDWGYSAVAKYNNLQHQTYAPINTQRGMKFDDNHWYRDPSASAGTRIRLTGKSTDDRDSRAVGDIVFFRF
jgi:hypothetical protein